MYIRFRYFEAVKYRTFKNRIFYQSKYSLHKKL